MHDLKTLACRKADLGFLAGEWANDAQRCCVFDKFLHGNLCIFSFAARVEFFNTELLAIDAAGGIDFGNCNIHSDFGAHADTCIATCFCMGQAQDQLLGHGRKSHTGGNVTEQEAHLH